MLLLKGLLLKNRDYYLSKLPWGSGLFAHTFDHFLLKVWNDVISHGPLGRLFLIKTCRGSPTSQSRYLHKLSKVTYEIGFHLASAVSDWFLVNADISGVVSRKKRFSQTLPFNSILKIEIVYRRRTYLLVFPKEIRHSCQDL